MASDADRANGYGQLIDVIGKGTELQLIQIRNLSKVRKLRRLHPRQKRRAHRQGVEVTTLIDRLQDPQLEQVLVQRRNDFVTAIRASTDLTGFDDHRLLDGSLEMDLKYAAFQDAYESAMDVQQKGGSGLTPSAQAMNKVEAASPGLQLTNALVGSAVHIVPVAGGVYKEGKDNIEGIVSFVKATPGAAKAAGRGGVRIVKGAGNRIKKVGKKLNPFRRKREHETEPAPSGAPIPAPPEDEGPAPARAP